jgi:hypothetical protein
MPTRRTANGEPLGKLNLLRLRHALRRGDPTFRVWNGEAGVGANTAEMAREHADELEAFDRTYREARAEQDRRERERERRRRSR